MGEVLTATAVTESRITPRRLQFAAALLVLNVADVILTRAILDRGGIEANPLMVNLMTGVAAPMAVKVAAASTAGLLLLCCPARSRLADVAAATVVGLYIAVVAWNSALIGWIAFTGN